MPARQQAPPRQSCPRGLPDVAGRGAEASGRARMRAAAAFALLVPLAGALHGCPQYDFTNVMISGEYGTSSMDWMDARPGAGTCHDLIAGLGCALFAPGAAQAGKCDFSCGYCTPPSQLTQLPPCAPFTNAATSANYYDSWEGVGSCMGIIADMADQGATACDREFAAGGSMPHNCDQVCGYCRAEQSLEDIRAACPTAHYGPNACPEQQEQQCRRNACLPEAPVWARLSSSSTGVLVGHNYWTRAEQCQQFVSSGVLGGDIVIPSRLPGSQLGFHVTTANCAQNVANWAIQFGLSSESECMDRCDLGCAHIYVRPGCEPGGSSPGAPAAPPAPPPQPPPPPPPPASSSWLPWLGAAAVAALLVVGAALKREAIVELVMAQRGAGKGSSLQESIYGDETL